MMSFDPEIARHMERWAESHLLDDEREDAIVAMREEFWEDPDYYLREGWRRLYDCAKQAKVRR